MRDTVWTKKEKKRELYILLFCFIAANILNIVGILNYATSAKEIITQIPVVILISVILYLIILAIRLIWSLFAGIYRIFNKS